jgi:two-component system cell cycle response regulator DivK
MNEKILTPTVLVVEDDKDTRITLRLNLLMRGYRVVEATNGQEAVGLAHRACPDLILMDLGLPLMDGLAATRLIRAMTKLCKVPIVAITAYDAFGMKEAALEAGCDEYIVKPIDFDRLDDLLRSLLLKSTGAAGA